MSSPEDHATAHDDSDSESIAAALAWASDPTNPHPGGVALLGRQYVLHDTLFMPSSVDLAGLGPATNLLFDSPDPTSRRGTPASPRWGNVRTSAIAFVGTAADDMLLHNYHDDQTGDYFVTDSRPFARDTTLAAGATSFVAAAGTARDVSAGDQLWLERGILGWHTAIHELVVVSDRDGDVVHHTPCSYAYSNAEGDPFNSFFAEVMLPTVTGPAFGQPPGVQGLHLWRPCGWRKVATVRNSSVRNLRIRNVRQRVGYANTALMFVRASDCTYSNIVFEGGGAWHIDSQNLRGSQILAHKASPTDADTSFFIGNGMNGSRLEGLIGDNAKLLIEEGALAVRASGSLHQADDVVKVAQFSRDVLLELDIVNEINFGLQIDLSADVRYRGHITAAGAGLWQSTKPIGELWPLASEAQRRAVAAYFDPGNTRILGGSQLESTRNNGYEIASYGPVTVEPGVAVAGARGGAFDLARSRPGSVSGSLIHVPGTATP